MSISSPRDVAVAALIAVAACTSALGLDRTRLDTDRDGVDDVTDNCPDAYNPDQADGDGDGQGDACEPCPQALATHRDLDGDGIDDGCDLCLGPGPRGVDSDGDGVDDGCDPCIDGVSAFDVDDDHDGIADGCDTCVGFIGVDIDRDGIDDSCDACLGGPPDDQDGDGIEDGCDLCPVIVDPTNANGDADRVGDACDFGAAGSEAERVLFDGFRIDDASIWSAAPMPDWTVSGDQLHVAPASGIRLRASHAMTDSRYFEVLARVMPDPGSSMGIALVFQSTVGVSCAVDSSGKMALIVNGVKTPGTPVLGSIPSPPPFVVALTGDPEALTFRCELRDPANPHSAFERAFDLHDGNGRTIAISVDGGGSVDWIEALQAL